MDVSSNSDIAILLKKAVTFVRAGEWDSATSLCNKVLSQDPTNSYAYLGKLMAELHVKNSEDFQNLDTPFDDNKYYLKICQIDKKLAAKLDAYNETIYMKMAESYYCKAINMMKTAASENEFRQAAELFDNISGYKDADENKNKCLEAAEKRNAFSNSMLQNKSSYMSEGTRFLSEEPEKSPVDGNQPKQRKVFPKVLIIVASIAALLALGKFILPQLKTPKVISIDVRYHGSQEHGTVLDSNTDGFTVVGKTEDGEEITLNPGQWSIDNPVTLVADSSSNVTVNYKDLCANVVVKCTTSLVDYLTVTYDGPTGAGTEIKPQEDSHVGVRATYIDESTEDVKEKCKFSSESYVLEKDSSVSIEATYFDQYGNNDVVGSLEVKCSDKTVTQISAKYNGDTEAGTVLDNNNNGIIVTGTYKDGESEVLHEWQIAEPITLQPNTSSTVTITYEGCSCDLTVDCTTIDPQIYKSQCISVSVNELLRNPNNYRGVKVKISGKVTQVLSGGYNNLSSTENGLTITNCASYGNHPFSQQTFLCRSKWDYFYVVSEDSTCGNLVEDDKVTIYGEAAGTYSYTTVMGAAKTVPKIIAQYVVR